MAPDTFKIRLSCDSSTDLHVRFEPIGPEYVISGDDWLEIEMGSGVGDPPEITYGPGYVTVWGSPQTTMRASNRLGEQLHFLV